MRRRSLRPWTHILSRLYPPEHRHGISVAALREASVVFLVARWDGAAVGCGAVRFAGGDYAEVKRMYVSPRRRGLGVAQALLTALERLTRQAGLSLLRLETGDPSAGSRQALRTRRVFPMRGLRRVCRRRGEFVL